MQKFEIEVRNEKIKSYTTITLLIVILNCLFFIFLIFDIGQRRNASISLGFILLYAAYRFYICQKNKKSFFFDEWIFFLLMILWVNDNFLIAFINLILFLLYTITLQKIIYDFNSSLIKQKNFPWKKYRWNELSNVIIKDNLLTVDFKNNKLMQVEITGNEINETEFNAFTKKQLETF
ncbi:MAG: hypothetical protein ABJA71_08365 [Ginsengibacter sp.]